MTKHKISVHFNELIIYVICRHVMFIVSCHDNSSFAFQRPIIFPVPRVSVLILIIAVIEKISNNRFSKKDCTFVYVLAP